MFPPVSITVSCIQEVLGLLKKSRAFFANGVHLISFSLPMTMAYISSTMFSTFLVQNEISSKKRRVLTSSVVIFSIYMEPSSL